MKQVIAIIVLFLFHTIIQHIIITANNLHCHHHDEESDCVTKVRVGRLSPDVATHHCVAQIHVSDHHGAEFDNHDDGDGDDVDIE